MLLISTLNAQTLVKFNLRPDGTFQTDDGKNFVVVEFEGKTAQELYTMVKSNAITLYNSPKTVLSENEPVNLSILALSENLYKTYKIGGGFVAYKANYNLVFHFKDGRIRIDAPLVHEKLDVSATGVPIPKSFVSLVDDWFEKNGSVKKKKQDDVLKIEEIFNYPINYLLGYNKRGSSVNEEEW